MDDDFQLLGIERGASEETIRKAFRKACLQHHPDKNGDSAQFIRIMEAYKRITHARMSSSTTREHKQRDDSAEPFYTFLCEYLSSWMERLKKEGETHDDMQQQQKTSTRQPGVLYLSVPVTMEEIFRGEIKKIVVRMKNNDGSTRKEVLYVDLSDFSPQYVFKGRADEDPTNNEKGDIILSVTIHSHPYAEIVNGNTLRMNVPISFYETLMGFERTIPFLGKPKSAFETLSIKETGPLNSCIRTIEGHGLLLDEGDERRGPLTIMYRIELPYVNQIVYDHISSDSLFMDTIKKLYPFHQASSN
jgi:DnaJ-class molecular chaperone